MPLHEQRIDRVFDNPAPATPAGFVCLPQATVAAMSGIAGSVLQNVYQLALQRALATHWGRRSVLEWKPSRN
jgi:hypothetical protein